MQIQVLVAAMGQADHSLLQKMNIQSDAIVGNQCERNAIEKFEYHGHTIQYLNFAERGVGLNRNNALMRATGDICLFADDDMVYADGYPEMVKQEFMNHPDADVIVFNLHEPHSEKKRHVIERFSRVNRLNYLRYGAARIAIRLKPVRDNGIYFNQCFGGGTEHCAGEDNLFLTACFDKGLKIFASPCYLAELTESRPSTWNKGYDKKYLKDLGALYRTISRRFWKLLCLQDAIRRAKRDYIMRPFEAFRTMIRGGRER